jgi:hypothetical protein
MMLLTGRMISGRHRRRILLLFLLAGGVWRGLRVEDAWRGEKYMPGRSE